MPPPAVGDASRLSRPLPRLRRIRSSVQPSTFQGWPDPAPCSEAQQSCSGLLDYDIGFLETGVGVGVQRVIGIRLRRRKIHFRKSLRHAAHVELSSNDIRDQPRAVFSQKLDLTTGQRTARINRPAQACDLRADDLLLLHRRAENLQLGKHIRE